MLGILLCYMFCQPITHSKYVKTNDVNFDKFSNSKYIDDFDIQLIKQQMFGLPI